MTSRTAANMAAFRALESTKPRSTRLFEDAFAAQFLGAGEKAFVALSHAPWAHTLIEAYADWRAPGALSSGVARTRLIDDWIVGECADGLEQLVILGAGYDCRALRLEALATRRVFELDRADMIARKANILPKTTVRLTRVAVDFLHDSIETRLGAAGFDPAKNTLFLWEGVTNYLDMTSVVSVLDYVAAIKARLIFTYVHADAVTGKFQAPGLGALLRRLKATGEPWTFGIRPEQLADFLAAHGLRKRTDLGATEYRALYRGGPPAEPEGYEFYRVVLAEPA